MNETLPKNPIEEQLDLAEELWNSTEEDQQELPISRDHFAILDQRLAALEHKDGLGKLARDVLVGMKKRI